MTLNYYSDLLVVAGVCGGLAAYVTGSPLETASGWRTWFYVCIGCVVVFVPFIFTMHGPWSPRRARAEYRAHQERVAEGLRRLQPA
jgi:MFS transporter, ACS family, D-galactonate transporter